MELRRWYSMELMRMELMKVAQPINYRGAHAYLLQACAHA